MSPRSGQMKSDKHIWTLPIAEFIATTFADPDAEPEDVLPMSSVAYFGSPSPALRDSVTGSSFNLGNLAFSIHLIERLVVDLKVHPGDIGYCTPYNAQCLNIRFALVSLENFYKKQGVMHRFTMVKFAPIDIFEGGSKKVMINDYTAYDKLGFMSKSGRSCIILTPAEDFAFYIGNKDITSNPKGVNLI